MEFVHPNKPETRRNWPAPALEPYLVEEITKIGGLNECGEPHLRFVWGQSRMQFRRGKERLLYIDERIPAIKHTRHVLKRPLLYVDDRVSKWETEILSGAPAIVPEGWIYEEELVFVEFIGKQLWYVEQWYAPEINLPNGEVFRPFGTEEQWERDRYEDWDDPELGFVRHCDVLGPFPRAGRYTAIMFVGQPFDWVDYEEENVHEEYFDPETGARGLRAIDTRKVEFIVHDVCYRAPGRDTLEALRRGVFEREQRHIEKLEQRSKNLYEEDAQRRTKARDQRLEHARASLMQDAWRFSSGDGGPTGGVGGGARSYATPENLKRKKVA